MSMRFILITILFLLTFASSLLSSVVFFIDAKRVMAIVDEIQASFSPQKPNSAVIDTRNSAAYFGTNTYPGQVCKYGISSDNFSFVSCVAAPVGADSFESAVIDMANSVAYFGTDTNPGQVCKFNISSAKFSFVSCIAAPDGELRFISAVIDTENSAAYFGTNTFPGGVCKFNISSVNFSFVSCVAAPTAANKFFSVAVIDTKSSAVYFGANTYPGQVCKFNVSSANFSFVSCIAAPIDRFKAAVIDTENSAAYFGTYTNPGQVCEFNVSSANFSLVSCIVAPDGVNLFYSAVIDSPNSAAYFSTDTGPGRVCKYSISSAGFSLVSCIKAASGTNFFNSAVIDTQNSAAYFGTMTDPAQFCKYNVSSAKFSLVSCIVAQIGMNDFDSAVIDTQNSAAYFGLSTRPGQVCKYNVSSADFSLVSCIAAPTMADYFSSAVIDTQNSAAYFGTSTFPGRVCKLNISSSNFSFVSCIAAPSGTNLFSSAVIDAQNSAAYFGTNTFPGQVCKFNTASANFSFVSCIEAPIRTDRFQSAVIDTKNAAAYFGTITSPGQVCKYNVSSANFSFVSCIEAPIRTDRFQSAVIDTKNSAAYFGTSTFPGKVCKFNVSSANLSFVSCIEAPHSVSNFYSAVIDTHASAAYFGAFINPGQVCKFNVSSGDFSLVSCVKAPPGAKFFSSAVIDTQNSAAYFGTETAPGHVVKLDLNAFACNADGQLAIGQDDFFSQSNTVNFVALDECNVEISSVAVDQPITFLQSISSSNITIRNITSTSTNSFVRLASSTQFASPSTLMFEDNQFEGNRLLSSPSDVDLSGSSWLLKCNRWVNGYNNGLKTFASQHDADQIMVDCPRTLTTSLSLNRSASESESETESLSQSLTSSRSSSSSESSSTSLSESASLSTSTTPSQSASLSESIYCFNLNQQQCSDVGPGNCHFCSNRNICVPREQDCNCAPLDESLCPLATGCKYCSNADVCVENDLDCECYVFGEAACQLATSTCRWCSNFNSCLPQQEQCYCSTLGETACTKLTQNKCTYCPQQEICLPTAEVNQRTCSCLYMNSTNCQTSKCSWCDNYQTCGLPDWDCDCTSLSNSSPSCAIESNNHCKLCQEENVCVDAQNFTCRCENFTESVCDSSSCRWCDTLNSCTLPENDECNCYLLRGQQSCDQNSNGKCHFCSNFDSCLPLNEKCYCSTLSEYACTSQSDNMCTYCSQQEICLPTTDFTKDTCSCLNMNSSNCQTSKCSWCANYQTCGLPDWNCDCTSLSNSSSLCSVNSNKNCKLCQDEHVCVDAQKFTCRCENFTQSVCGTTSSCRWCDTLNSCTLPENKNCTCNWLRFEDSCNRNSNNKCSWCATSSDAGTAKHNSIIPNFNYCINNDGKDQCQCSYLSPSFCAAANDPSLNQNKNLSLSTSCRYCPVDDICVHPGNDGCECGNFEQHACAATSLCTWKDPVLTSDGAVKYCSAASVTCSPVMCEGILTKASCDSSGCSWNPQTVRCGSNSVCFNFFVTGFTPQPMLLWVIGLLKDVLVVFLVGAYANTFTRPIMKFVTAVKKKVLKQTHIKQQMMEEAVYMCDKHCRDDLPISFPQYVERVCESVFELENDDLLDEKNRRVLFDSVAYTLFDNMIWVDVDLLQNKDNDEVNFNKKFGLGDKENSELSQHEMKDLTVDRVDVKDDEGNDDGNDQATTNSAETSTGEDSIAPDERRQSVQEFLESLTASLITQIAVKHASPLEQRDVNTRGQIFGRFFAAVGTQYDTYLKTKNVDFLKIKVFLTARDFDSSVTLTKKVDESLIERASAYVFYDQSRSRKVCAAASANTFPPALSLVYYSVALLFLFISSFITVSLFKNFKRMVQSCDEFIPLGSNNASDSNVTTTTADSRSTETVIDGSYLTGAYFLLGFRLLNSSAFSTAILVFVKVVRGIYQRFSGIYTLSLQERIPLMALYSDRFTHVMLFLYGLLVLPFALCGPTYGSSFGVYCWVPIFIAAAILIGDAMVLYVSRRFSSLKNRLLRDKDVDSENQLGNDLNEHFEDFLDSSPSPSKQKLDTEKGVVAVPSAAPTATAEVEKEEQKSETSENLKENLLSYTPREGDDDDDHHVGGSGVDRKKPQEETDMNEKVIGKSSLDENAQLDEEVVKKQSSIEATSPVNLWNALLVFIMTEEIPVIVISLALQLSFNYAALLHYGDAFGLSNNYGGVYDRDYDSRSLSCIVSMFENDVSSFVSGLSSFVPFM